MNRNAGYGASLAVLVAVNILNFYDRHVIGALTEPIRKEFLLTDSQVGLMNSAFIWLYAIVGLPLGSLFSLSDPLRFTTDALPAIETAVAAADDHAR